MKKNPTAGTSLALPPFKMANWGKREKFGRFLNQLGLNGIGVEVGTHQAEFAAKLLSVWKCEHLYCVDPWAEVLEGYHDHFGKSAKPTRQADMEFAISRLRSYSNVTLLRMLSQEAAERFADGTIDFVYIDGNHEMVAEDIDLWWPKVKEGGILAGHDIEFSDRINKKVPYTWRPVTEKALRDRFQRVMLVYHPGRPWSWYVHKERA